MATNFQDQMAIVRRLKTENATLANEIQSLKGGGGGGTSGDMVPLKDYVDKADEAIESRLDAKLDRLATKGTVWGAVATVLGILLAVLALATSRFDSGMAVRAGLEPVIAQQQERDKQQDRKLDAILERLPSGENRTAAER